MWNDQGLDSSQLAIEGPSFGNMEDQTGWSNILNDNNPGFSQSNNAWVSNSSNDASFNNSLDAARDLTKSSYARSLCNEAYSQGDTCSGAVKPSYDFTTGSGRDGDRGFLYEESGNNPVADNYVPDNPAQQALQYYGAVSGDDNQPTLTAEEAEALMLDSYSPMLYYDMTTAQNHAEGSYGQSFALLEDRNAGLPYSGQDNAISSNVNRSDPQPPGYDYAKPKVSTADDESDGKGSTDTSNYSCYSSEKDYDHITEWDNYDDHYYFAAPR